MSIFSATNRPGWTDMNLPACLCPRTICAPNARSCSAISNLLSIYISSPDSVSVCKLGTMRCGLLEMACYADFAYTSRTCWCKNNSRCLAHRTICKNGQTCLLQLVLKSATCLSGKLAHIAFRDCYCLSIVTVASKSLRKLVYLLSLSATDQAVAQPDHVTYMLHTATCPATCPALAKCCMLCYSLLLEQTG